MLERARDAALHARGWFLVSLLFVFDMDEVIYDYDWRRRMAGLEELTGVPFAELRARWWNHGNEGRAEAGGFADGAAYLAALNEALGSSLDADQFVANRRSGMTLRPAVVAAIERAAELGDVSLLTNNGPLVDERLPELAHELVPLFGAEHLRASSRYGARKPDPAVFRAMLAAYDADPADVLFADDLPENVAGAASVGITAHRYLEPAGLLAAIESFAAAHAARSPR
jgi:glucose-1-phosphatase